MYLPQFVHNPLICFTLLLPVILVLVFIQFNSIPSPSLPFRAGSCLGLVPLRFRWFSMHVPGKKISCEIPTWQASPLWWSSTRLPCTASRTWQRTITAKWNAPRIRSSRSATRPASLGCAQWARIANTRKCLTIDLRTIFKGGFCLES